MLNTKDRKIGSDRIFLPKLNQNIKVIAFALDDNDPKGMERLFNSVEESMKNGNWIIIDNAHLVKSWSSDMLKLFYVSLAKM